MDIAGISMSMATQNTQSAVGMAVLGKSLDVAQATGDKMVEMIDAAAMERSVNPNLGGSIDLRV